MHLHLVPLLRRRDDRERGEGGRLAEERRRNGTVVAASGVSWGASWLRHSGRQRGARGKRGRGTTPWLLRASDSASALPQISNWMAEPRATGSAKSRSIVSEPGGGARGAPPDGEPRGVGWEPGGGAGGAGARRGAPRHRLGGVPRRRVRAGVELREATWMGRRSGAKKGDGGREGRRVAGGVGPRSPASGGEGGCARWRSRCQVRAAGDRVAWRRGDRQGGARWRQGSCRECGRRRPVCRVEGSGRRGWGVGGAVREADTLAERTHGRC
ncbi:hypothetical protein PVAP13_3KG401503 [Panicum virgatum]|uniref:Uncharacterized protein n=1 Tax=Panicum virgatum TaxID=38727 RepID=A0A8T0UXY3_PANVG|nr:hypothetical protein PVAP13_3KG401503 [Panicum virgatum]